MAVILSSIHGHRIGGMEYGMNQKMTASTTWEEIGISNDFMFGKVMQQPELCRGLLQRILPDLQIDRIEYPEAQKGIRADVDAKSVRLDVYIKDGKGTVYDIEMQVTDTGELPKRTRYYQSLIDLQLIDKGEAYRKLKPSYIIFICFEFVNYYDREELKYFIDKNTIIKPERERAVTREEFFRGE